MIATRRTASVQHSSIKGRVRSAARIAFAPERRNILHWLSWTVTLVAVLALTGTLANGAIYGWEIELTRTIQSIGYPEWLFQLTASRLEDPMAIEGALIVTAAISLLWILRLRIEAAIAAFALPLHVLGNFPKALIDRARPSELFDGIFGVGGDMSFTSGHSEFAITFYGFLAYLAVLRMRSPVAKVGVVLAWLSLVLLVGFGRVAHGHHWPLDIAGGYIVGIGLLSGLTWLHRAFTQTASGPDRVNGLRAVRSSYEPASPGAASTVAIELRQREDRHAAPEPGTKHVGRPMGSRVDAL